MNSETVKPMPAAARPAPTSCARGMPSGSAPQPARSASERRAADAEQLADHQAGDDAQRERAADSASPSTPPPNVDARVGEREQRHDHERAARVQAVLDALAERDRHQQAERRRRRSSRARRTRGRRSRARSRAAVRHGPAAKNLIADHEHGRGQPATASDTRLGVEDRDDRDRDDVVDDRDGEQEHARAVARHAVAEQREHADRERDVGGARRSPSPRAPSPPATSATKIDDRRDHAADRGERRQRRGARGRCSSPVDELALDLEPDDEEEHAPSARR